MSHVVKYYEFICFVLLAGWYFTTQQWVDPQMPMAFAIAVGQAKLTVAWVAYRFIIRSCRRVFA